MSTAEDEVLKLTQSTGLPVNSADLTWERSKVSEMMPGDYRIIIFAVNGIYEN